MDLELAENQKMLQSTVRDFLAKECPVKYVRAMEEDAAGYTPELWRKMSEMGWLGLPFPERYGGTGGGFFDLCVLLDEMGRACLPSPFFSTVVLGGLTILEVGTEEQKRLFLHDIAGGKLVFSLALTESSGAISPDEIKMNAVRRGNHYILDGVKTFVPDALASDYILCLARTNKTDSSGAGLTLFLTTGRSPGVNLTALKTIGSEKLYMVDYRGAEVEEQAIVGKVDTAWPEVLRTLERASVGKCCEMIGGAQQVLEMTVSYAKERFQFNQPIGSFQAVQHHLADMLIDVDSARFITYQAAWMLDRGLPCAKEVSMAKAWTSLAYKRVCALGHQIHGAIGFTRDHDMQLYFRRAKAAEVAFGDADYHREIVANCLGI